jgi:hypothetical protein
MNKNKRNVGISTIPVSKFLFTASEKEQREWAKKYLKKVFSSFNIVETENKNNTTKN